MKVTDEMVERATRARVRTLAMAWDKAERIVLEAALADVPEPVNTWELENAALGAGLEIARLEARIAELEAKLDQAENEAAGFRHRANELEAKLASVRDVASHWETKAAQWLAEYRADGIDGDILEAPRQQLVCAAELRNILDGERVEGT